MDDDPFDPFIESYRQDNPFDGEPAVHPYDPFGCEPEVHPYDELAEPVISDDRRLLVLWDVWDDFDTPHSLREKLVVAAPKSRREDMIVPVLKMVWNDRRVAAYLRANALVAAMGDDPFGDTSIVLGCVMNAFNPWVEGDEGPTPDAEWMCRNYAEAMALLHRHQKPLGGYALSGSRLRRLLHDLSERFETFPDAKWLNEVTRFLPAPAGAVVPGAAATHREFDRAIALMEVTEPKRTSRKEGWRTVGQDFVLASPWVLDEADLNNPDVHKSLLAISRFRYPLGDKEMEQRIRDRAAKISKDGALISLGWQAHSGGGFPGLAT